MVSRREPLATVSFVSGSSDRRSGVSPRQIDLDRRPFAGLAVDLDVPAGLFDEAVHLRESKPGSVTDVLGGEERIERLCLHVRRHSASVVRHRQHDVLAGQHLVLGRSVFFVQMDVRGLQRQLAPVRHGVPGVHGQIENGHLQLIGIGVRHPEPAAVCRLDRDLFAKGASEEV